MIRTNWHTHTKRCGHAVGEDEEYVLAAIQGGLKTLGFSDHAAYPKPQPSERMDISEVPDYIASIRSLQEKYKNQIRIHLGMEVEYYPDQWETLSEYRRSLDYLILGQHNVYFDSVSVYSINDGDTLHRYVDMLEKACERNLCDYIAHPDVALYRYQRLDGSVRECAARIADISLKYNMPLELNAGSGVQRGMYRFPDGLRYPYPTRVFFEEFARKKCPIIIGLDVHDPRRFLDDTALKRALSVIADLNCNILEDFDLVEAARKRKKEFR